MGTSQKADKESLLEGPGLSGAVWCAPAHPARPHTHASLIEEGPVLLTPPKPDTPLDTPIRIRPLRFVLIRLGSLGPPSLTPGQSHDLALPNGLLANVVHVEAWKVLVKRSLLILLPCRGHDNVPNQPARCRDMRNRTSVPGCPRRGQSTASGSPDTRASPAQVSRLQTCETHRCLRLRATEFWGDVSHSITVAVVTDTASRDGGGSRRCHGVGRGLTLSRAEPEAAGVEHREVGGP